jgi:hypothetical protein
MLCRRTHGFAYNELKLYQQLSLLKLNATHKCGVRKVKIQTYFVQVYASCRMGPLVLFINNAAFTTWRSFTFTFPIFQQTHANKRQTRTHSWRLKATTARYLSV